jgi:E3 ubiquitin-protein ligase HECTD4
VIVSVCLKQHGLESALELLGCSTSGGSGGEETAEEHSSLLDAVFTRINGLERRIQVLAELEKNWWTDVDDITKGSMSPADAFFFSLLTHETSLQNFELLCCLKNVDTSHGDIFTSARQLQDIMELDVEKRKSLASTDSIADHTPVTRQLVAGVMERARLLLSVTIARGHTPSLASYTSTDGDSSSSAADQGDSGSIVPMLAYVRSISAPPITAEYAVRRQRSGVSLSRSRQALLEISSCPDKSNLLHQIFMFIGSKPEKAVSPECFLAAANQQWRRGVCRTRALRYLYQLLSSDHVTVLAVEHLLASVGSVIQRGPGVKDIGCGGMAQQVREAFAGVMHAVVELASKQPSKCINTIAMLCVVPYTRLEETCLVRSGLVKLLDRLCSQVSTITPIEVGREEDEEEHRVTSLAWAAFQVLADRCVSWESQEDTVVSSGLAQQVAMLLTNHLSRAMDSLVLSETGASETLQDALSLLLGLARSQMGRAILSQPSCVSKLLLLLTDQRPSPKLVLIALQLCRIALPLMTVAECSKVVVPPHPSLPSPSQGAGLPADIVQLLLAKLAEYIVPQSTEVPAKPIESGGKLTPVDSEPHPLHSVPSGLEKEADESGQASVYIYKRSHETSAEILQPLISQDSRQLRLAGPRMQEVMLIDRALSEHGRAEMFTDNYRSCQRRALRWASMGFVVSIESPSGGSSGEEPGTTVDKKKAKAEAAAKKKNLELLKRDPPRPFLSGQVAYSLASEVIGLLHGLVTVPGAAEVWSTAIREALLKSLCSVPELAPKLVSFSDQTHRHVAGGTPPPSPGELVQTTCIANATFAALGGFKESIRPGMRVKVVGEGLEESCGVIQSIAERRGVASVQFSDDEFCFGPNKTLDVPLSRLLPPQKEMLPLNQLQVGTELCSAMCAVLKTTPPSISHAHSSTDASNASLGLCRLFAEMRSRACMALLCHIQQSPEFLRQFVSSCCVEDLRNQLTSDPGEGGGEERKMSHRLYTTHFCQGFDAPLEARCTSILNTNLMYCIRNGLLIRELSLFCCRSATVGGGVPLSVSEDALQRLCQTPSTSH